MTKKAAVAAGGVSSASSTGFANHRFIIGLDIGTTNVKAAIYDETGIVRATAQEKIKMYFDQGAVGRVELDPEELFQNSVQVIKSVMQQTNQTLGKDILKEGLVVGLGISSQRGSFVTWDKRTGQTFHPVISWQDNRASDYIHKANTRWRAKAFRVVCMIIYFVTRLPLFCTAKKFKFSALNSAPKFAWVKDNIPKVKEMLNSTDLAFGGMDTWIVWNLTKGKVHATDHSSVCATGMFEPYGLKWSGLLNWLMELPPTHILPEIRPTGGDWGSCDASIFGTPIPIHAVISDQTAALYGQCCFSKGDVKVTMGTGTFINMNVGEKCLASSYGLYPIIAWSYTTDRSSIRSRNFDVVYMLEGNAATSGSLVEWLVKSKFCASPSEAEALANTVVDDGEGNELFVPAFTGLQVPHWDPYARGIFIGATLSTSRESLIRAVLTSLSYMAAEILDVFNSDSPCKVQHIHIDGGVARNNLVCQTLANLSGAQVERPTILDMTLQGAVYLAGVQCGLWTQEDLQKKMKAPDRVFKPQIDKAQREKLMRRWRNAVERSKCWEISGREQPTRNYGVLVLVFLSLITFVFLSFSSVLPYI